MEGEQLVVSKVSPNSDIFALELEMIKFSFDFLNLFIIMLLAVVSNLFYISDFDLKFCFEFGFTQKSFDPMLLTTVVSNLFHVSEQRQPKH